MRDRSDWRLNPLILHKVLKHFPRLEVDLFATRLTYQLPRFYRWRPDPLAEATDALLQDWRMVKGFANTPWSLIGIVLTKVQSQETEVILIAPIWPSQPWYPRLLGLLVPHPLRVDPQAVAIVSENPPDLTPPLAYLRQHYSNQRLSEEASDLLLSSWRQKTSQSYDSLSRKWISWCTERHCDPVSGPIEDVVNFLAHLYKEGYQYRSLNAYRSAIASMHTHIDGVSIGQHPLVSRLLRGGFQTRPPLPRYQGMWDVNKVLNQISSHGLEQNITLKQLTLRTVMLLALTRPSRSADLAKLNIKGYKNNPEGAVFTPTALAKQSRPGRDIKEFFFPKFTENENLCPVKSLSFYIEKTVNLRGNNEQLFISFIKPHHPVTSPIIARWLKVVMEVAGIDTSIFKAHSVRSASTSTAATQGVTTEDILSAADWSTESSFQQFYYKPIHGKTFAKSVLTATNNTIDM